VGESLKRRGQYLRRLEQYDSAEATSAGDGPGPDDETLELEEVDSVLRNCDLADLAEPSKHRILGLIKYITGKTVYERI
jgi:hypothetical protein